MSKRLDKWIKNLVEALWAIQEEQLLVYEKSIVPNTLNNVTDVLKNHKINLGGQRIPLTQPDKIRDFFATYSTAQTFYVFEVKSDPNSFPIYFFGKLAMASKKSVAVVLEVYFQSTHFATMPSYVPLSVEGSYALKLNLEKTALKTQLPNAHPTELEEQYLLATVLPMWRPDDVVLTEVLKGAGMEKTLVIFQLNRLLLNAKIEEKIFLWQNVASIIASLKLFGQNDMAEILERLHCKLFSIDYDKLIWRCEGTCNRLEEMIRKELLGLAVEQEQFGNRPFYELAFEMIYNLSELLTEETLCQKEIADAVLAIEQYSEEQLIKLKT